MAKGETFIPLKSQMIAVT